MSAITGLINFNREPINSEYIASLMDSFKQYPSDAIDIWKKDYVFLGCHAQWITPEQVGEVVPYYDSERQLVITADAIIDNRQELFDLLQIKYINRKEMTDSQLILLAYEKWGDQLPKQLVGDFAFMIWDEKKQKLFGARDFSGSRTLYFHRSNNRFVFSTTMKSLLTLPYIDMKINNDWLAQFIVIPSMVEAADMQATVHKSIEQVPPSHSISVIDGHVKLSRYCKINVDKKLKLKSDGEYEEAFKEVFARAVSDRTRTYGEVGSHLSGGLDSGTVVSFAAKQLKKESKQLHTFSYIPEEGFEDWTPNYYNADETSFIKETVAHVGNINDHYMSFPGKSPYSVLDEFLEIMEMPYKFFENSFWLKGFNEVAQEKGIKIILSGARGNNSISFGSHGVTIDYYTSLLKKFRFFQLFEQLNLYCANFNTGKSVVLPFIAKESFPLLFKKRRQYEIQNPILISPLLANKTKVYEKIKNFGEDITGMPNENPYDYRNDHFEQLYTWNKSGTIGTKLSLRHSLWDRDPTNDIRVIRFCLSIPNEQYSLNGMERSFIRRVAKNLLPNKVRLNQQIRGVQGADTIHRMSGNWHIYLKELGELTEDPRMSELFNIEVLKEAILRVPNQPPPEYAFNDDYRMLTRCLVIYRFIKNSSRREVIQ